MSKKILAIILTLTVAISILVPITVEAKTIKRYATQKIALKQQASSKSKTLYKIKTNTCVILQKKGKKWSRVKYYNNSMYAPTKYLCSQNSPKKYTRKQFKRAGRIRWRKKSWTWYTQRILPGRGLKIPGRHVDKNGFVCDKNDYIVLASSIGYKKQKKILPTPFGKFGKVYDTNGTWNYNWRDVYTNW